MAFFLRNRSLIYALASSYFRLQLHISCLTPSGPSPSQAIKPGQILPRAQIVKDGLDPSLEVNSFDF